MTPISDRNSPEALRRRAKIEQGLAEDFAGMALLAERVESVNRYERLSLEALAVSEHCLRRATELGNSAQNRMFDASLPYGVD